MQTYYVETIEESIQRTKLAKYKTNSKTAEPTSSLAGTVITEADDETSHSGETSTHLRYTDGDTAGDFAFYEQMSKTDRLVEWNVEILSYLLKQIMVARPEHAEVSNRKALAKAENGMRGEERPPTTVLDEFKEIIELPYIGAEEILQRKHPDTIVLPPVVVLQLRDLIKTVADMYNENHFHNFEHASHVTGK